MSSKVIRIEASKLLNKNPEATIDELIKVCQNICPTIDEEIIFEAIAGTTYSCLYSACGY